MPDTDKPSPAFVTIVGKKAGNISIDGLKQFGPDPKPALHIDVEDEVMNVRVRNLENFESRPALPSWHERFSGRLFWLVVGTALTTLSGIAVWYWTR